MRPSQIGSPPPDGGAARAGPRPQRAAEGQQNLGWEVSEQVCWQCKRADTGEFVGFLAYALQAGVTGVKAHGEQWSTIILAACHIGMRRFETEVCRNPIGDSPHRKQQQHVAEVAAIGICCARLEPTRPRQLGRKSRLDWLF
jgi:hypothetical protein